MTKRLPPDVSDLKEAALRSKLPSGWELAKRYVLTFLATVALMYLMATAADHVPDRGGIRHPASFGFRLGFALLIGVASVIKTWWDS